jgi:hypothetical protein
VTCGDCITCPTCGAVAYCLAEIAPHPCAHDGPWCEDHRLEECVDCRREAFVDLCAGDVYDAAKDPFFDPSAQERDAAYWAALEDYDPAAFYRRKP